jgi:hypothetical protein
MSDDAELFETVRTQLFTAARAPRYFTTSLLSVNTIMPLRRATGRL